MMHTNDSSDMIVITVDNYFTNMVSYVRLTSRLVKSLNNMTVKCLRCAI